MIPRVGTNTDSEFRNIINLTIDTVNGQYSSFNELMKASEYNLKKAAEILNQNQDVQQQINNLVSDNGQSDAEVVQARGYNKVLNDRLKAIEENENKIDTRRAYQSLVSKKTNKPMITWIDDDGHVGVYNKLAPLLREYKIKMTSAIVTNFAHGFPLKGAVPHNPKFMSYEQMKEIENEGLLEYVCHTHTHNLQHKLTDMTEEELHEELSTNQNMIRALGWNHRHLVYPFGEFNDNVIRVVKQYFDSAFNTRGGTGPFNVGNIVTGKQIGRAHV